MQQEIVSPTFSNLKSTVVNTFGMSQTKTLSVGMCAYVSILKAILPRLKTDRNVAQTNDNFFLLISSLTRKNNAV